MASLNDIRSTFLDFFRRNGHRVVDSSPLVPRNDPTLMFTNSGMVQFKNLLHRGRDARLQARDHGAEMRAGGRQAQRPRQCRLYRAAPYLLRNAGEFFSFGDYFKDQAIAFAWELLTKDFGLAKDKLLVTVYHTDDEAASIWKKVRPDRRPDHPHRQRRQFLAHGPDRPLRPLHRDLL
jgi:alanyl-tRNA synthetase